MRIKVLDKEEVVTADVDGLSLERRRSSAPGWWMVGCPALFPPTGAVWKMSGSRRVKVAALVYVANASELRDVCQQKKTGKCGNISQVGETPTIADGIQKNFRQKQHVLQLKFSLMVS